MSKSENVFNDLSKIFHEPKRLAIMSLLAQHSDGISFSEIKKNCEITDGNLNRHLHMLEEAKAIKVNKSFAGVKPLTTIKLTANGRKNFLNYLTTLEEVLRQASTAMENGDIRKAKTI
ncbi:MAG: transcriptional regulator [Lentisphaeria bacterium]|nr:transcriptional regulator [Lentisphaeria bacterium]NQZ66859.1 transcriptional regulator [Lentisphaeria bacterium]